MKTRQFFFLVLICFSILSLAHSDEDDNSYATIDNTGTIERPGKNGEGALQTGKQITFLEFTSSPAGYLMYLEKTRDFDDHFWGCNREYEGNNKKDYIKVRKHDFDPDIITLRLHVCDASLKDIAVVPIPARHGTYWNQGRFHGDGLVVLEQNPRWGDTIYRTVANLKTKEVFSFEGISGRDEGFPMLKDLCLSPDGGNFLMQAYVRPFEDYVVFLNGEIVYPAYVAQPALPANSSEEFKARAEKMKAMRPSLPQRHVTSILTDNLWSADGRYFSLLEKEADTLQIRTVDAKKVRETKNLDRASLTQAVKVDWGKGHYSALLRFRDGKIEILGKSPDAQTTETLTLFRAVDLPPDWKERINKK